MYGENAYGDGIIIVIPIYSKAELNLSFWYGGCLPKWKQNLHYQNIFLKAYYVILIYYVIFK